MDTITFYERVHDVARQIPYGRVTSYGAIAAFLGSKGSSRMVGYAMNNAHAAFPPIPAHRVVNSSGLLTGKFHFGSPDMMQQLLENEGVEVVNDKVVGFKEKFWSPGLELGISQNLLG
jgi:methylated-DNA-protein-cysteine methyltransferase-like protein